MQHNIEELKQQIQALKKELLALPSVELKSEIDDLQAYIRISTELLKAVAAFQVLQNVEEEKVELIPEPVPDDTVAEEQPETESLEIENTVERIPEVEDVDPVKVVQTPAPKREQSSGIEVAEMLANNAIDDLRSAFGLNERFYFTNELFGGDGQEFVRAINEFNHLESFEDAKRLLSAKFIPQFGWKEDNEIAEEFITVIKRRYS
ncbi:MAG: hypothetical protein CL842_02535 [Crocinitomicaceae bacterium]|nr:hypothetical protein [Crocinitomicaceae bacterium]|tara:strand:- start:10775 stop:11392 length:618 start_codon:yes stop_codon:yes gene_type:complete